MTYQTNELQQTKQAKTFKKVAQGHGSVIMTFTEQCIKSGIDIRDPKADVKFAKLMKKCVRDTQKYYTPRA